MGGWSGSAPLEIGSSVIGILLDASLLSLLFVLGAFEDDGFDTSRKTRSCG